MLIIHKKKKTTTTIHHNNIIVHNIMCTINTILIISLSDFD